MPQVPHPTPSSVAPSVAAVLIRTAINQQEPDLALFATVIAKSLDLRSLGHAGLAPDELDAMALHFFPLLGLPTAPAIDLVAAIDSDASLVRDQWLTERAAFQQTGLADAHGEFTDLIRDLLGTHCVPSLPASGWVISTLAQACLRPDHLWRDLGLTGRDDVTALLNRHFPTLVKLNVQNLRWKQFLSYAAHEQAGLAPSPAPGCPGCEDYDYCYAKA